MALRYLTDSFNEFAMDLLAEWKVPGASLAVVDGHDIQTKALGFIRPNGSLVTNNTLFGAASMSKSFTAGALALLVDDNDEYSQVQWDTPVSSLLPDDFVLHDGYCTKNVMVADILSHRTGVPGHDDSLFGSKSTRQSSSQSTTRSLRHFPCTKPLRTAYQYNNMMYIAASHLVETLSGIPFPKFLEERFWDPLGMNYTSFGYRRDNASTCGSQRSECEISPGFYWDSQSMSYVELSPFEDAQGQGAGGITSNIIDWAHWIRSMIEGTSGISAESIVELTKPLILVDASGVFGSLRRPDFYGMGWHIHFYRGFKVVTHAGGIPGHSSLMMWLPEKRWGFVVFGNSNGMDVVSQILGWTLIDTLLNVSQEERIDWAQHARRGRSSDDETDRNEADATKLSEDSTSARMPAQFPLTDYTGRWFHPIYDEMFLHLKNGRLFIDASDRMFGFTLSFHHVSGNTFVAEKTWKPRFAESKQSLEAVFEVNDAGKLERMGIDFLGQKDSTFYIWFIRAQVSEHN